ncbi:carbohydrate kinase family protein [Vibrio pomeroyi]|uniref:carbohydrate kinase family protein n=1 Tax=Vibrio pomeroyi TaxID=198832 RepID=UPI0035A73A00
MKLFEVLAVGDANIDTTIKVDHLPKHDDKVLGEKVSSQIGGTVANSACVLGSLGVKVTALAKVGTDGHGAEILNEYAKYNIDTSFVEQIEGFEANQAIIMLDDTGEKSLIFVPACHYEYSKSRAILAVSQAEYLYTMPGDICKFVEIAALAYKYETKVVVDIESTIVASKEDTHAILTHSDIVFFNEEGFTKAIEQDLTEEILHILIEQYNLDTIIVTLGANGVLAANNKGEIERHSGFEVEVIDTTGAGDTFNASFLFSKINGYQLDKSLEFSCAAAAYSIGGLGPKGAVPTIECVTEFLLVTTSR